MGDCNNFISALQVVA